MCAFTHTGGLHIQRWVTVTSIEARYDSDEILGALNLVEYMGAMSGLLLAKLMSREDVEVEVLAKILALHNEA